MWLVETVFSGLRKQGADISKARLKLIDRDISWGIVHAIICYHPVNNALGIRTVIIVFLIFFSSSS